MGLLVPVSWGELLDKITILEIKSERIAAPSAVANVRRELELLSAIAAGAPASEGALGGLKAALKTVNERLWDIEDRIREKEAHQRFDGEFVELARAVYHSNDERGRIKRQINLLLKSELIEEKQYASY